MEFKVSWKEETASFLMMTKLSSTYLFQILGVTVEVLMAPSNFTPVSKEYIQSCCNGSAGFRNNSH